MASVQLMLRAQADREDAVAWHAARSDALAQRFEVALGEALDLIGRMPELYAEEANGDRHARVGRTRYRLVYRYDPAANAVTVAAIVHASQDPAGW